MLLVDESRDLYIDGCFDRPLFQVTKVNSSFSI